MFAVLAILCFLLEVFNADIGVNLVALGLALMSAHLVFGLWPWARDGAPLRA